MDPRPAGGYDVTWKPLSFAAPIRHSARAFRFQTRLILFKAEKLILFQQATEWFYRETFFFPENVPSDFTH